jgi:hypothetical protein
VRAGRLPPPAGFPGGGVGGGLEGVGGEWGTWKGRGGAGGGGTGGGGGGSTSMATHEAEFVTALEKVCEDIVCV